MPSGTRLLSYSEELELRKPAEDSAARGLPAVGSYANRTGRRSSQVVEFAAELSKPLAEARCQC
jgi:hypothetical protein